MRRAVFRRCADAYAALQAGAFGEAEPRLARFFATAADREAGESSVPLHELKAFRRVTLPPAARSTGGVKDSSSLRLRFEIPVSSLQLMRPDGTMGLLAGQWRVWVGGTSPRTPAALLRSSSGETTSRGAPQPPLEAEFKVQ